MSLTRYSGIVLGAVAVTLAAVWPNVGAGPRGAVLLGAAIASANAVLAYALTVWSIARPPNVFMGVVLGGMGVRMVFMLGVFVVAVAGFGMPPLPLAVSLLAYFVAFLVFELAVLHRRTSAPRAEAR